MAGKGRRRERIRKRYERRLSRHPAKGAATRRRAIVVNADRFALGLAAEAVYALKGKLIDSGPATVKAPPARTYQKSPKQGVTFVGLPPRNPDPSPSIACVKTNHGTAVVRLSPSSAPCEVNSFRYLAGKALFHNTGCHRLVTTGQYVLECGGPSGTGSHGPGDSFPDGNLEGATYPRGTVAMANSGPDTNGSEFFFVTRGGGLDSSDTCFGKVVKGLEIVDHIACGRRWAAPQRKVEIEDVVVHD